MRSMIIKKRPNKINAPIANKAYTTKTSFQGTSCSSCVKGGKRCACLTGTNLGPFASFSTAGAAGNVITGGSGSTSSFFNSSAILFRARKVCSLSFLDFSVTFFLCEKKQFWTHRQIFLTTVDPKRFRLFFAIWKKKYNTLCLYLRGIFFLY